MEFNTRTVRYNSKVSYRTSEHLFLTREWITVVGELIWWMTKYMSKGKNKSRRRGDALLYKGVTEGRKKSVIKMLSQQKVKIILAY